MANLGRPILARPEQIEIKGVNQRNIQMLQKNLRQAKLDKQKQDQLEQSNRIREAQIYVQAAKTALNQKKLKLEMDQFDREAAQTSKEMDMYEAAQKSWDENIVNNPNVTREDIQKQAQTWFPITNSKVHGNEGNKRLAMLQKMDEQILGSEMIKSRNEYMDARNNGMAWDSPEELSQADPDGNIQRRNKIVKKQINTADDGTPVYGWVNTGEIPADFMRQQRAKLERLRFDDSPQSILALLDDDDFGYAMENDDDQSPNNLRARFEDISDKAEAKSRAGGKGLQVTAKVDDLGLATFEAKGTPEDVKNFLDEIEQRSSGDGVSLDDFDSADPELKRSFEQKLLDINENLRKVAIEGEGFLLGDSLDEILKSRDDLIAMAQKVGVSLDPNLKEVSTEKTSQPIQPTEAVTEVSEEGVDQMRSLLDNLR